MKMMRESKVSLSHTLMVHVVNYMMQWEVQHWLMI